MSRQDDATIKLLNYREILQSVRHFEPEERSRRIREIVENWPEYNEPKEKRQ